MAQGFLGRLLGRGAADLRAAPATDSVTVSVADKAALMQLFGFNDNAVGEPVSIKKALGVPAISAAVEFWAMGMASLPIHLYQAGNGTEGPKRIDGDLVGMLNEAVNEGLSSFDWRKYSYEQMFTVGRGLTFIERNVAGRMIALWPLDPTKTTVMRSNGVKRYKYQDGSRTVFYEASEVIDLPFMLDSDQVTHRSPILDNAEVVAMAIAATQYGAAFFRSGGVPPFVIQGKFQTSGAMQRAADDLEAAVRKASREKRQALVLPEGLEVKQIGIDAEKAQLIETQKFMILQFARIFGLPPVFLQDLSTGTYSNTEQQDLHLVKHALRPRVKQFEDELNLKLFGWKNRKQFVKLNMDALLRGDFKSRMDGYAAGIRSGVYTPNDVRALEDLPPVEGGNVAYMQGAMVPMTETGANGNDGQSDGGQNGGA